MKSLPPGPGIVEFIELTFKPGMWDKSGVPEQGCRIRQGTLEKIAQQHGAFEADDLILGLMDWLDVTEDPEPAIATLQQILDRHYPWDGRTCGRCHFVDEHGADRVFHAGRVDPRLPLVAWQRRDWIIAAAQPSSEPGCLVVGAPQPLTLNTAQRILSTSVQCHMGEPCDSFVSAQTVCTSNAVFYRWEAGEVTPTRWDEGLDAGARGSLSNKAGWLPPNQLAIQVAIGAGYLP